MDIRKVKKLIELLEESNLNELEITEGDDSVRISRGVNAANYSSPIAPAITPQAPAQTVQQVSSGAVEPSSDSDAAEGHKVNSPMVGTFYSAPAPGSEQKCVNCVNDQNCLSGWQAECLPVPFVH